MGIFGIHWSAYIYYSNAGKMENVNDIALFAIESHSSPLITLTPETYVSAIESGDEWLIDYYAPVS